jgi:hypothetical protein
MILGAMVQSYGCLKFSGRVWPGRACTGANQQELTTCTKSGGQEKKKIPKKMGRLALCKCRPTAGGQPLVVGPRLAGDQRSLAGRGSTLAQGQSVQFLFFFKTFFEACPDTWKCKILHFLWRLEISLFSNFFLPKFRIHLGLHIYRWDFWFMKN